MVERRSLPLRKTDLQREDQEPLIELARRKSRAEGVPFRETLRALRAERRERAYGLALAEAPACQRDDAGGYVRVSSDPRWPFGVEDGKVIAPFGLAQYGLPRIKTLEENKSARALKAREAKAEVREVIMDKLERLGCDPIKIMAELALDKSVKAEVRLRAAAELSSMVYPRLRSTETQQRTESVTFVIGVPAEQPKTTADWLESVNPGAPIIESTATEVEDE